jgi:hypothetical protein
MASRSPLRTALKYHSVVSRSACAACGRTIDSSARLCPYCGANPQSGERIDTQAIVQEVFRPREVTTSQSVMEYARQRQGIVIAVSALVAFLLLAAFHQFVTMRNATAVTDSPAVPLSEVTELTKKSDELAPAAMPRLNFPYEGRPQAMRTFIVESGAVKPPDPQPAPTTGTTPPPKPALTSKQ